ncbi:MAG: PAS domain S-box protein [Candidatus Aminicenantes bacterium]|nr:PAS domain S-box protein [Candidatus Aminicenantes bacterium]
MSKGESKKQSKQPYRYILDTVPNPIFEVAENLVIILANTEAIKWWPEIVEGKSRAYDILALEQKNGADGIVEKTFRLKTPQSAELGAKDGMFFNIKTNYVEEEDSARAIVHILDITGRRWAEEALRQSKEQYRLLFDSAPDGVSILDTSGTITMCNRSATRLYGYTREEMVGKHMTSFIRPSSIPLFHEKFRQLQRLQPAEGEIQVMRRNGSTINIWRKEMPLTDAKGKFSGVLGYDRDITERKRAEEELRKYRDHLEELVKERTTELRAANEELQQEISERKRAQEEIFKREKRYRTLFDLSPSGILLEDMDGNIIDANPAFCESFGYSTKEIIGQKVHMFTHPDIVHQVSGNIGHLISGEVLKHTEKSVKKDGSTCYMNLNEKKIVMPDGKDGILCVTEDISERIKMEKQIKASLEEKEVLLKEIHHRVKNNLQIVSSLLSLQSGYIKDEKALQVFKNSRERVRTMALVHEELYRSRDLSKIDFREYINRLIQHLFDSYSLNPGQVQLKVKVQDVFLDVETTIPLGLIINELITNSLKYAFPGGRKGELHIYLGNSEDKEYDLELRIGDNGIGIPEGFDLRESESLGMVLVDTLVKQLRGKINYETGNGASFTIKFKQFQHKKQK